jgi:hypothetical protein
MSTTTDLARAVARALLDYADRVDAAEDPTSQADELPPISEGATAQRRVVGALADAPDRGLPARSIAQNTGITQMNVYEKLDRLGDMGYVEEVPGSSPKHWRLTLRGKRMAREAA